MKFSTASLFVALALVASADAGKKKLKKKDFIGDCSDLSFETIEFETGYDVTDDIVYAYPCSKGYLPNFAANKNLLKDVREAINEKGKEMGIDADCANLCDINNGSYSTKDGTTMGKKSLKKKLKFSKLFCNPDDGVLNNTPDENDDFNTGDEGDLNACRCVEGAEDGYIAGCYECSGTIEVTLATCLNSSAFEKSSKSE